MNTATQTTDDLVNQEYKYGFVTEIETDTMPRGLNEATVRSISAKKNEPSFVPGLASSPLVSVNGSFASYRWNLPSRAQKLLGVSVEGSVGQNINPQTKNAMINLLWNLNIGE